ncbi:MAG: hypothetical protein R3A43_04960 [Bacteroidia bacterium]
MKPSEMYYQLFEHLHQMEKLEQMIDDLQHQFVHPLDEVSGNPRANLLPSPFDWIEWRMGERSYFQPNPIDRIASRLGSSTEFKPHPKNSSISLGQSNPLESGRSHFIGNQDDWVAGGRAKWMPGQDWAYARRSKFVIDKLTAILDTKLEELIHEADNGRTSTKWQTLMDDYCGTTVPPKKFPPVPKSIENNDVLRIAIAERFFEAGKFTTNKEKKAYCHQACIKSLSYLD